MTCPVASQTWKRTALESKLFDTATIYEPPNRATAARTTRGDIDDTFPTNWTATMGVSCRVELPKRQALIITGAGQSQSTSRPTIYFPLSTVISNQARVKITASLDSLMVGQVFNVVDSNRSTSGLVLPVEVKVVA